MKSLPLRRETRVQLVEPHHLFANAFGLEVDLDGDRLGLRVDVPQEPNGAAGQFKPRLQLDLNALIDSVLDGVRLVMRLVRHLQEDQWRGDRRIRHCGSHRNVDTGRRLRYGGLAANLPEDLSRRRWLSPNAPLPCTNDI